MSIRKIISKTGIRWEVRYRLNGRNSKRIKKVFLTKRDAEAHLHEWRKRKQELKLRDDGVQDFEETTFEVEAKYWLSVQMHLFSPGHLKRVKGILGELTPLYGALSPLKFHPGLLSKIQMDLLERNKPATVNRKLEAIRAVLNFSAKQRRIPYSPTNGYTKLRDNRSHASFWEVRDAENFLAFVDRKYPKGSDLRWVYVVYLLALNTGLRAGEIWGLKFSDLKQDAEVLHIQRQFDRVHLSFRPTKGKADRLVPCNAELRDELKALLSKSAGRETVFGESLNGNPICHENFVKRRFIKDVREWGGRKIRFHDMRHTAITQMIGKGLDIRTVQEIAGHKDIQTTLGYAHLLGDKIKEAGRLFSITPSKAAESQPRPTLRLVKNS